MAVYRHVMKCLILSEVLELKSDIEEFRMHLEAEAIVQLEDEKKVKKKRNVTKIGTILSLYVN